MVVSIPVFLCSIPPTLMIPCFLIMKFLLCLRQRPRQKWPPLMARYMYLVVPFFFPPWPSNSRLWVLRPLHKFVAGAAWASFLPKYGDRNWMRRLKATQIVQSLCDGPQNPRQELFGVFLLRCGDPKVEGRCVVCRFVFIRVGVLSVVPLSSRVALQKATIYGRLVLAYSWRASGLPPCSWWDPDSSPGIAWANW